MSFKLSVCFRFSDDSTTEGHRARCPRFHGVKWTHVEVHGILCGREGDYVAMRVSKRKKSTCFQEHVSSGGEKFLCSNQETCGCGKAGHIVGIVRLGVTDKVCRKKVNEIDWREKPCCKLPEPHSFVTELTYTLCA